MFLIGVGCVVCRYIYIYIHMKKGKGRLSGYNSRFKLPRILNT